jgi:hypothetical protein
MLMLIPLFASAQPENQAMGVQAQNDANMGIVAWVVMPAMNAAAASPVKNIAMNMSFIRLLPPVILFY